MKESRNQVSRRLLESDGGEGRATNLLELDGILILILRAAGRVAGPHTAVGGKDAQPWWPEEPRRKVGAAKTKPLEMPRHPKTPHWKRYLLPPLEAQALRFDFFPAQHAAAKPG